MKAIMLVVVLALALAVPVFAVNADSLGGQPWQSYLRSVVEDTASGPLYLNQVNWLYGYAEPGKRMMHWDNSGNGIIGYNRSSTAPLIYGVNESNTQPWMEARVDSFGPGLIRLHGNLAHNSTNDLIFIDQVSPYGAGLGIYNTTGTGIYIDHGGDKMGMRIENNFMSTGYGLWIDNQNSGTAMYVSDTKNGRMIVTSQDSANKPAITILYRGSQSGLPDDSCLYYWWGIKGRKAEVETLKTALCGLRTFGNSGQNLCDTITAPGVAESTTVVTASYAGGFESATCTPLRIKVESGTIIVKRGAVTDPVNYYWQATKMLGPGQIVGVGPECPLPDSRALGFSLYPNPSSGLVTAKYALSRPGPVELGVYNLLGQKVRTMINQWQPAGYYIIKWDGKNDQGRKAAAGVYLYKLKAGGRQETQKMVVVR